MASAVSAASAVPETSGRRTANSSPPRRARVASVGHRGADATSDLQQHPVAHLVTEGVVDLLETIEVHQDDAGLGVEPEERRSRSCTRSLKLVLLRRPVSESCWARYSFSAAFCCRLSTRRPFLQRHARVRRQRLQQFQILLVEGSDVAEAVADQERSDDLFVTSERRHHRVLDAKILEVSLQSLVLDRRKDQEPLAIRRHTGPDALLGIETQTF